MIPARRTLERKIEDIIGKVIGEHQYYIQRQITGIVDEETATEIASIVEAELNDAVDEATSILVEYVSRLLREGRK